MAGFGFLVEVVAQIAFAFTLTPRNAVVVEADELPLGAGSFGVYLVAFVILWPENHPTVADFRRLAQTPALFWYGTPSGTVCDRGKILSKLARASLEQLVALFRQRRLGRSWGTPALGRRTETRRSGTDRA
uniref:Putative secreted protein n=1 Tax=Anopheles marajoara TaxID=58244 RepID=A0A2M4C6X1_9DIPT